MQGICKGGELGTRGTDTTEHVDVIVFGGGNAGFGAVPVLSLPDLNRPKKALDDLNGPISWSSLRPHFGRSKPAAPDLLQKPCAAGAGTIIARP